MPLINGEKFACDSCIKGHRVSGCQHHDRELRHINPKGRPVKQCEHCRGARKSKAHHAKCECGDRKGSDDHSCSCHHGKQCLCGTRKGAGLKVDTSHKAKPRLTAAHSETALTVFANGHHKPCHRLNNAAHTSGTPYKIPKSHHLHGAGYSAFSGASHIYNSPNDYGRRSADHLPYGATGDGDLAGDFYHPPRSVDNLPLDLSNSLPNGDSGAFDMQSLLYSPQQHMDGMQSMSASPVEPLGSNGQVPLQHWPMHGYVPPLSSHYGVDEVSPSPSGDYSPTPDHDWAMSPAGLEPSWSAIDLPLDPSKVNSPLTQPMSHSGESIPHSVPGLTSSPGIGSDSGEPGPFGELDPMQHHSVPGEPSALERAYRLSDRNSHRFSAGLLQEMARPPTSEPDMGSRRSLNLDPLKRPHEHGGMAYYLESHGHPKEVPRSEPMTYGSTSSPDLASLQALHAHPEYSGITSEPRSAPMFFGVDHEDDYKPSYPQVDLHSRLDMSYDHAMHSPMHSPIPEWSS